MNHIIPYYGKERPIGLWVNKHVTENLKFVRLLYLDEFWVVLSIFSLSCINKGGDEGWWSNQSASMHAGSVIKAK